MRTTTDYTQFEEFVNIIQKHIADAENGVALEISAKKSTKDNNFEKTRRAMLSKFVNFSDDPIHAVAEFLINNVKMNCNLIRGTYETISKESGISQSTVVRAMRKLQEKDFIRPYSAGCWMVHPSLLSKGSGEKYMALLREYYSIDKKRG